MALGQSCQSFRTKMGVGAGYLEDGGAPTEETAFVSKNWQNRASVWRNLKLRRAVVGSSRASKSEMLGRYLSFQGRERG